MSQSAQRQLVIPAWMPESSQKDVNPGVAIKPFSNTYATDKLPSLGAGFRHTCRNDGNGAIIRIAAEIRKILDYIGESSTPPKISQARGPPLWDAGEAAQRKVFDAGPARAIEQQIGPAVQFDQSVNW